MISKFNLTSQYECLLSCWCQVFITALSVTEACIFLYLTVVLEVGVEETVSPTEYTKV